MKTKKSEKSSGKAAFRDAVASLYPVARGSLALVHKPCTNPNCSLCKSGKRHPAWIFGYVEGGKRKCLHVQPRHVETVRKAIDNGRKLEEMILKGGLDLMRRLREED